MAELVRLIVTDNSTAARTMADRLAQGKARSAAVHAVPVYHADTCDPPTTVIGLGGLLFTPTGDPPEWQPARRAPARALRKLAQGADTLVLVHDDPLLAIQARGVVGDERPDLMRSARTCDTSLGSLRHLDDLAAAARALDLEIDALVAAHLARIDPHLTRHDLAALGELRRDGAWSMRAVTLGHLAERGYVAGDPAWLAPAGRLLADTLDPSLLDGKFASLATELVHAVGRGTVTATSALDRARDAMGPLARPAAIPGIERGRLIGVCPDCGEWMGGVRNRIECLGCGCWYPLPRQVEALALPGSTCDVCDAPMILPVVHGRRDEPRCPDTNGCPTRMGTGVGT